jgi:membrane protein
VSNTGQWRRVGIIELSKRSIKEFSEDHMTMYAAGLAYQVLLSLFPFAIFLVALLGFLQIPGFFDWIEEQLHIVLPAEAAGLVDQIVEQVRDRQRGDLLSFGILVALWSASAAVRGCMDALNVAFDIEEDHPAWKKYPLSVFYTISLAVILVVATGLLLIGPQVMEWLAEQMGLGTMFVTLWSWLRFPVAVLLLMIVVALIYYLFPNGDQPFRLVTPGAVLAVLVWIAASLGFSYYVSNFSNYSALYGSLGGVIVLLIYFFISAAVLLFGAEVNAEIYHKEAEEKDNGEKTPEASRSDE